MKELLDKYLACLGRNECPTQYHRWTLLTMIAALIGRKAHIQFGYMNVYPNLYTILIGPPATKRSTAIKMGLRFITRAGYDRLSADAPSKEALWHDMAKLDEGWILIAQDEISDFIGKDAAAFTNSLCKMYDNPEHYKVRKRGSGGFDINAPTITIMGATNHSKLHEAFGANALEGGFLSRCFLINAKDKRLKVPFPTPLDERLMGEISDKLSSIYHAAPAELTLSSSGMEAVEAVYEKYPGIMDRRFEYYDNRRHMSLLKMCIIVCVSRGHIIIDRDVVIEANTLLHIAEIRMPKALGEFGRSKVVAKNQVVLNLIQNAYEPISLETVYTSVSTDFDNLNDLMQTLSALEQSGKVQSFLTEETGIIHYATVDDVNRWSQDLIDYRYLTDEENPDVISPEGGPPDEGAKGTEDGGSVESAPFDA